jgi:ankyrin repeat protein
MTANEVAARLERFGIEYEEDEYFKAEEFHEMRFVMSLLNKPECLPMLEALLENCTPDDLVWQDTNALMWAMICLSYEKVQLLAKKPEFIKAYINAVDREEQTAFHYFADRRNADVRTMELLIELGADINAVDCLGWTALHHFACYENVDCSEVLFKYRPIIVANNKGNTPAAIERAGSDWHMPFTNIWVYEASWRSPGKS